jgi:hypothetical protein
MEVEVGRWLHANILKGARLGPQCTIVAHVMARELLETKEEDGMRVNKCEMEM